MVVKSIKQFHTRIANIKHTIVVESYKNTRRDRESNIFKDTVFKIHGQ